MNLPAVVGLLLFLLVVVLLTWTVLIRREIRRCGREADPASRNRLDDISDTTSDPG